MCQSVSLSTSTSEGQYFTANSKVCRMSTETHKEIPKQKPKHFDFAHHIPPIENYQRDLSLGSNRVMMMLLQQN